MNEDSFLHFFFLELASGFIRRGFFTRYWKFILILLNTDMYFRKKQLNSTYGEITIIRKSIEISGNNILKNPNRINV